MTLPKGNIKRVGELSKNWLEMDEARSIIENSPYAQELEEPLQKVEGVLDSIEAEILLLEPNFRGENEFDDPPSKM